MNIKCFLSSIAIISSFPMCFEKIQDNIKSMDDGDSYCESDSSILDSRMVSDNTSFSGSSNTLNISFSSKIKEHKIEGKNLKILSETFSENILSINVDVKNAFSKLSIDCVDEEDKSGSYDYFFIKRME